MIKVERENNKIEIKGHANYDDYGKDIVCASVSSIVITTINAIIEFDPESIYYEDLNNRILIEKLKDDDITNKLINNMIELLEELEKSSGKKLGDKKNPLLVSVRSGARASMPGMMDTILNLGLNDEIVESFSEENKRFIYEYNSREGSFRE